MTDCFALLRLQNNQKVFAMQILHERHERAKRVVAIQVCFQKVSFYKINFQRHLNFRAKNQQWTAFAISVIFSAKIQISDIAPNILMLNILARKFNNVYFES